MASFATLDDLADIEGKRALVRVDLNVPMQDGRVSDDTRLRATLPTVTELADKGAIVLLLAHFGRPKGAPRADMSLALVTKPYEHVLGRSVQFVGDWDERSVAMLAPGDVAILENTRFDAGEEQNDPAFARRLAALGDLYVNDAFSTAHRAHASTEGLAHLLPAYAGRAMEAELRALERALGDPERPVAAVVGGAKVSTKLDVLRHLVGRVEHLIIGGGMANTFLAARGVSVGRSLAERDLTGTAEEIFEAAERAGCTVHLPYDVVVAKEFAANPPSLRTCNVHEVAADEMILDIGPAAVEALADVLKTCRTLVWNGPLGAFETPPFEAATVALARTAAALTAGGQPGLGRRRRRHRRGAQPGRRRRRFHLRLHRRRRLPRMDGRQGAAGRGGTHSGKMTMQDSDMMAQMAQGRGFIAALDQSGGSTPKALKGYGIEEGAWSSDEEMFGLIHQMRSRIITSPAFTGDKVIGAILFERTMDGEIDGKPVPQVLNERGVVPFIKIDKGLEAEAERRAADEADARSRRAARPRQGPRRVRHQGALGDQPRRPCGHRRDRRPAVRRRPAGAGRRPRPDHRARGQHQEPGAGRGRPDPARRTAEGAGCAAGGRPGDAEAVASGRARPVRPAGRSSAGAARGRPLRRLFAARGLRASSPGIAA